MPCTKFRYDRPTILESTAIWISSKIWIRSNLVNSIFSGTGARSDSRFAPSQWETALLCAAYGSLRQTFLYISNWFKTDSPWTQITHLWLLPIFRARYADFDLEIRLSFTMRQRFTSAMQTLWRLLNSIQFNSILDSNILFTEVTKQIIHVYGFSIPKCYLRYFSTRDKNDHARLFQIGLLICL